MKIVDAHCHLESPELKDDLHKLLNDAYIEGVVKIITSSVTIDEWYISKDISKNFPEVEYTVGVHPWYVKDSHFDIYKKLGEFYTENRDLIAIGEIGLDKKIDSPPFYLQQMIFEEQMKFAVDVNLPVIIHCRGAFNELTESLKKVGMPKRGGIIHAFSGSVDIALTFIKKG
ncbi:MAG TPA: TatD family hydrolase, partial [Spirochaetota bacterium]|nr:TatD family hydrolase [Spirochaetota bacterium]